MTDARRWVRERRPGAPPSLAAAMDRVLAGMPASGGDVPEELAAAGLSALERVVGGPAGRASAPTLLAADALLTYACEAAAAEGVETLERLVSGLGLDRFESLLRERPE